MKLRHVAATGAQALLIVALAWGAFAFGAVYAWSYWPLAAAVLLVAVVGLTIRRGDPQASGSPALLASAFAVFAVAGLLQLVPLPIAVLDYVSPERVRAIAARNLVVAAGGAGFHALSLEPSQTIVGLIFFSALALLTLGCTRLFSICGARRVATAISVVGIALALAGIVQSRFFNGRIYGLWTPLETGSHPFGPFVNRNHFAGWMLMALPLTLGLLSGKAARALRQVNPGWRERLIWLSSPRASRLVLTAVVAIVMALSLVMTMSRSGMLALAMALVVTGCAVARDQRRGRSVALAYLFVLTIVAVGWAGTDAIAARFSQVEFTDRRGAWADAIDIASRFPVAGTGFNTYGVATLVYQQHDLEKHYSAAHNDFLQLAAEGGVLLTLPAMLCAVALILTVRQRFSEETSARTYWLRVGACTGLAAVALQEMFDFSLQMPGNAVLFAVLCAIALHKSPSHDRPRTSSIQSARSRF